MLFRSNTSLGRFDSTDPVFEGSANAYDYVDQNPVTGLDLEGTSGNRNGLQCGSFSGRTGQCRYYLSEFRTRQVIDFMWDGVALGTLCAALGAASFVSFVGAVAGMVCGIIAAIIAVGAYGLSQIDDAGHNVGLYIAVDFYRFQWWWWGWHHRWIPYGGYIWHQ